MNKSLPILLRKGLRKGAFTAAEILVAHKGLVVAHHKSKGVLKSSRFDLSSLTKPLVTTSLLFRLFQQDRLDFKSKVSDFLPTTTLKKTTLLSLLNHEAGLLPWHDFLPVDFNPRKIDYDENRNHLFEGLLNQKKFIRNVGKTVYSDLGYMILGQIIEKIAGERLDTVYLNECIQPIQRHPHLVYFRLEGKKPGHLYSVIPSGVCLKRQRLLKGEVQDTNAYWMGGVSGHAGLFGGALDIHQILAQWRLAQTQDSALFTKDSFNLLWQALRVPLKKRHRFIYGFDTVSEKSPNFGTRFSRAYTLCHLGFSGVSFAWDLKKDLWVIVLTNRGLLNFDNPEIYPFRTLVHNQILSHF